MTTHFRRIQVVGQIPLRDGKVGMGIVAEVEVELPGDPDPNAIYVLNLAPARPRTNSSRGWMRELASALGDTAAEKWMPLDKLMFERVYGQKGADLPLPTPTGQLPDIAADTKHCECGAAKLGSPRGSPGHSSWCPWNSK